jgi:dipeptidyl aminopeptidase/acylaminoacyl peptidase
MLKSKLLFCVFLAVRIGCAQQLENALKEASAVQGFASTSISPDGKRVAWVESIRPRDSAIYIEDISRQAGSKPRRITAGDGKTNLRESAVAWSPDSRRIAFLSDALKRGQLNLYVAEADSGTARRLTDLKGFVSMPRWSPNGKEIGMLFIENAARDAGPLVAATRETGVISSVIHEQRIAIVDSTSGAVRQISPADMYVYEFDWSPDSSKLAIVAAHGSGDNNWWVAQLYTVDAASGNTTGIYKPPQQIAIPRWSPDGRNIAVIGGIMSDEGSIGGDVFVVPASGGAAKDVTPDIKISPSSLSWHSSPDRILFTATAGGGTAIGTVNLKNQQVELLWRGDESLRAARDAGVSFSADEKVAATVRSSFKLPPEVWAGPIGEWKPVTAKNQQRKPLWGEAKSLTWKNDNFNVQGWLLYPPNYDASRKYPMVVSIHGGPASARKAAWPDEQDIVSVLSQQNYFQFFPNPRGSYGQGEAFTRGNVKDFGYGDLRDVLSGVDTVLKTVNVDPKRIGVTGWSYGGYMTMWAVTQTNRFRAAVAGAGIANWKSYYGENGIDEWMIPYFGASVYDAPNVYAKSSPIEFIKNVKTPTLVLVGERDSECPAPQSYEFWHALRTLGVKTELVVYEDEGHAIMKPEHRLDRMKRTVEWFNSEMK